MSTALFELTFPLAAPFWLLMIVLPGWRWTHRIVRSPLIVLPPLVVWAVVVAPELGTFLATVTSPSLGGVQHLAAIPGGAAAIWAQIIAWDLFIGRWMYLDSRDRRIHPLVMAPVLFVTILVSPVGLPGYLLLRRVATRRCPRSTPQDAPR